jgi:[ribosomal protein S5]-alanine N-acetyltransferase
MIETALALDVPDRIETRHLRLRRPLPSDAPQIFRDYAQDPEVTRFMIWPPHRELAETEAFLMDCERWWREGGRYPYAVAFKNEPRVPIGMIEMRIDGHRADFGYVLARRYWNRGLMTEALSALVNWALAQPAIYRAQAFCDIDNHASARVMEKAGLEFEGILRRWLVHSNIAPAPRDCRIYSRVR